MTEQIPDPNPAWWPLDYCDEVMPKGRASPDAWIVDVNGVAMLGPIEDGDQPVTPLGDGDITKFTSCVTHANIGLTLLAPDGHRFDADPPASFGQCCILNGLQSETLEENIPAMIALLREAMADTGETEYLASFYTYDDGAPYRFIAAERRFEKVTAQ